MCVKYFHLGKQEHRTQALFNHTEEYVMFPDEATTSLCAWNARNASRQQLLSLGIMLLLFILSNYLFT